jgi:hypothetical protein
MKRYTEPCEVVLKYEFILLRTFPISSSAPVLQRWGNSYPIILTRKGRRKKKLSHEPNLRHDDVIV